MDLDKKIEQVAQQIGIPADQMPSKEELMQGFKEIREMEKFIHKNPPRVVLGTMYYMSKGAPFQTASQMALEAEDVFHAAQEALKKKDDDNEPTVGAMVNIHG